VQREPDDPNDAVPEDRTRFEYRREGIGVTAALMIGLGVLLLVFVLQNLDDSNVDFLVWDWDVPIAVAIVAAAVLGFVLGSLFTWLRRRARRVERRRERD
jgi:uncharacterized integral membrane protein